MAEVEISFERFCNLQVISEDNPLGNDCFVKILELPSSLLEKMGAECPYVNAIHARYGIDPDIKFTKKCVDFKPIPE